MHGCKELWFRGCEFGDAGFVPGEYSDHGIVIGHPSLMIHSDHRGSDADEKQRYGVFVAMPLMATRAAAGSRTMRFGTWKRRWRSP